MHYTGFTLVMIVMKLVIMQCSLLVCQFPSRRSVYSPRNLGPCSSVIGIDRV
jgi:hypothetical protein